MACTGTNITVCTHPSDYVSLIMSLKLAGMVCAKREPCHAGAVQVCHVGYLGLSKKNTRKILLSNPGRIRP